MFRSQSNDCYCNEDWDDDFWSKPFEWNDTSEFKECCSMKTKPSITQSVSHKQSPKTLKKETKITDRKYPTNPIVKKGTIVKS